MAYVVQRPGGRWEIRESYTTERGPRSRTLATFKALSPQVMEHAASRARTTFDPDDVLIAAKRAGAPIELLHADALATALLRELAEGTRIRPGLRRLLIEQLGGSDGSEIDDSLAQWIGASDRERADALVTLLDLADRLPKPPRRPLRYPESRPPKTRNR